MQAGEEKIEQTLLSDGSSTGTCFGFDGITFKVLKSTHSITFPGLHPNQGLLWFVLCLVLLALSAPGLPLKYVRLCFGDLICWFSYNTSITKTRLWISSAVEAKPSHWWCCLGQRHCTKNFQQNFNLTIEIIFSSWISMWIKRKFVWLTDVSMRENVLIISIFCFSHHESRFLLHANPKPQRYLWSICCLWSLWCLKKDERAEKVAGDNNSNVVLSICVVHCGNHCRITGSCQSEVHPITVNVQPSR